MATEADWGRLYMNSDSGDVGLAMPPQSYYIRDFQIGSWTDLSIGFIHRMSSTGLTPGPANDYTACADEALSNYQDAYLFQFGLSKSNSETLDIPIVNNPYFLGWRGVLNSISQIVGATPQITHLAPTKVFAGATSITGIASSFTSQSGDGLMTPFNMYGIRFFYNSSTQQLYMNHASQSNVTVSTITDNTSTLTTFLQGISTSITPAEAQFTITDISQFRTFLINWPFLANRLFIQALGVIKNA